MKITHKVFAPKKHYGGSYLSCLLKACSPEEGALVKHGTGEERFGMAYYFLTNVVNEDLLKSVCKKYKMDLVVAPAQHKVEAEEKDLLLAEFTKHKHSWNWLTEKFTVMGLPDAKKAARTICEAAGYRECCGTGELFHPSKIEEYKNKPYQVSFLNREYPKCPITGQRAPVREFGQAWNNPGVQISVTGAMQLNLNVRCGRCTSFVARGETEGVEGNAWCPTCVSTQARRCARCGLFDRRRTCECAHEGTPLHDYSYKPKARFQVVAGEKPTHYWGLEVEMEKPDQALIKNDAFWYYKRDGSVPNGVELVTHPFTDKFWRESGKETLRTCLEKHKKAGARSYDTKTCGCHIHVSRTALGDDPNRAQIHLAKMLEFISRNAALVLAISRRESALLDQWASCKYLDGSGRKHSSAAIAKGDMRHEVNRRQALNIQPRDTLEFRIFRGTLSVRGLDMNLQFCQAVLEFCRISSYGSLWAKHFTPWVREHRKLYPDLDDELMKKGMLAVLKPNPHKAKAVEIAEV